MDVKLDVAMLFSPEVSHDYNSYYGNKNGSVERLSFDVFKGSDQDNFIMDKQF